jgi:hypothetical protein
MTWHTGEMYKAWEKIHHALYEAMKQLPPESLHFLSFRASDAIIRQSASHVLDWLEHRDTLPSWLWFSSPDEERLRSLGRQRRSEGFSSASG